MAKRTEKQKLYDKAWDLMSIWVRKRDKGICITCGKRNWDEDLGEETIKGMQAGHFHHGRLDFDDVNINCQCPRCNKWLHGNLGVYAEKLIEKYGLKEFKALSIRASKASSGSVLSIEDIQKIIIDLEAKIDSLDD